MPSVPSPDQALYPGERPFPIRNAVDHYAGTEALMPKALALQARRGGDFDLTLDLEDGAPAGAERAHAALVVELLAGLPEEHPGAVGVRVHDGDGPHWRRDLEVVLAGAGGRLSHLTLPKLRDARQGAEMIGHAREVARRAGLAALPPVHLLIETPTAVEDVFALAALPGVGALEFGIMDFVSGHHGAVGDDAMRSPGQFEHALVRRAKTRLVAAALGAGLVPVHNVTLAVSDAAQVEADARRARTELGFLRMWSIHPAQIDPILRAFAPDHGRVETAGRVLLAAWRAAWAPVALDGVLYDRASYRYWWQVLQRARLAGQVLPGEVEAALFG